MCRQCAEQEEKVGKRGASGSCWTSRWGLEVAFMEGGRARVVPPVSKGDDESQGSLRLTVGGEARWRPRGLRPPVPLGFQGCRLALHSWADLPAPPCLREPSSTSWLCLSVGCLSGWNEPQLVLPSALNYIPAGRNLHCLRFRKCCEFWHDDFATDTFSYPVQRGHYQSPGRVWMYIWSFILESTCWSIDFPDCHREPWPRSLCGPSEDLEVAAFWAASRERVDTLCSDPRVRELRPLRPSPCEY